jgi:hypothetical protein
MKRHVSCLVVFIAVVMTENFAYCKDFVLQKGQSVDDSNVVQIASSSMSYAIAMDNQIAAQNDPTVIAFLDVVSANKLYSLSSNSRLYISNSNTKSFESSWEFNPYGEHLFLGGEYSAAAEEEAGVHGYKFTTPASTISIVADRKVNYDLFRDSIALTKFGCYQTSPLRYGDINSDNVNELILFSSNIMAVFSTQLNEVIFSAHYWMDDELAVDEIEGHFPSALEPGDPQYIASSGTDVLVREKYPAWRSLSKLYFDDFDGDENQDIILWRKLYQSRLRSDTTLGFNKYGETLVHYIFENEKYILKKETSEVTLRGWLNSNNQTWSSGYPSTSECAGQEGQLIPEMHDPLLNDPDVLIPVPVVTP